jgi:hypothetical protein
MENSHNKLTYIKAMDKFKENQNMFVNFSHIAVWDEIFNILLATVIFLTTLRLLKIISYSKRMNRLGYVLAEVSREIGKKYDFLA